ncbi:unnamed protein product [Vicia faba]|uniref:Uncharacterized protein n=1 Tax=Vicia faba TaxID=3906 RepID=A0AAV1A984_VICFA|nr:unnamed protein product [Vicia faba]
MVDSISTSHTTFAANSVNTQSRKIKTRGATMYKEVKKANEFGIQYSIRVDAETGKVKGEHADDFLGYIVLQDKSKMSILINSWHDIDDEFENNIWTYITKDPTLNEEEVNIDIRNLKGNASPSPDGIPASFYQTIGTL